MIAVHHKCIFVYVAPCVCSPLQVQAGIVFLLKEKVGLVWEKDGVSSNSSGRF